MLSRLTLPESVDACRMPTACVPAPSATVTDAVDQVSHDPVTGSVGVGPAAPSTVVDSVRVTDWPSPPCALAYRTCSWYEPAVGIADTSWFTEVPVAVKPARKPEPVKFAWSYAVAAEPPSRPFSAWHGVLKTQ